MPTILQLSDLHLWEEKERLYHGRSPVKQLESAINAVNGLGCEEKIVILSGDLTSEPTPKAYQLLSKTLEKMNAPVYAIAGNHDNKEMMDHYLVGKNIRPPSKIIETSHWLLILLDSSPTGDTPASGKLIQSELDHLKTVLANNQAKKNVLIFLHHPPILFGSSWFKTVCLTNRNEFNAIIQNNPLIKAVIFGHAHTQYHAFINGILYICAPSTWRQYDHHINDRSVFNDMLGGYNWYELENDGRFSFGTYYFKCPE